MIHITASALRQRDVACASAADPNECYCAPVSTIIFTIHPFAHYHAARHGLFYTRP